MPLLPIQRDAPPEPPVRGARERDVVLFLDVDGVLNCATTEERSPHRTTGVEPAKAALLRRIIERTGARIVLSSAWRRYPAMVAYLWENLGADMKWRCSGATPLLDAARGEEIASWLASNPGCDGFVILDDDGDMDPLMRHLVRTDSCIGLTPALADEVIARLLNGAAHPPENR